MPSESDIARKIVAWLQDHRWEVYQEVDVRGYVADIVCMQGPLVWVIEVKKSLSLGVMSQAHWWLHCAHRVSVAVPKAKPSRGRSFARFMLRQLGIGLLVVTASDDPRWQITEDPAPKLQRRCHSQDITDRLTVEQKTWAEAGSPTGNRWTPFKATCRNIFDYVKRNPGCSLKNAVDNIRHHYSSPASAKSSLAKWLNAGHVIGVEARRGGRKIQLYCTQETFHDEQ